MKPINGGITAPAGFLAAGVACGIKSGAKDLAIIASEEPCVAAGMFTTNRVKAASVQVTRKRLQRQGAVRAIVINSGNANCCTGERGIRDALRMTELCAEALAIRPEEVLVASTGPIGKFLPMENVEEGIRQAVRMLRKEGAQDAAEGIMTTDTVPKQVAVAETIGGAEVRIGAMAKGAGMIEPKMATMLAFIATDAAVGRDTLSECLRDAVDKSFNRITVDGNRSTNDMVLALANGVADNEMIRTGPARRLFQEALDFVCSELAKMIVKDGEGAAKFIEVVVKGARSVRDADKAARAIANSSLVKTALHGGSPNWGRIMAALGYSGANIRPAVVDISISGMTVARGGEPAHSDESRLSELLRGKEIQVVVDLHLGRFQQTIWTCDLSAEYVAINV